MNIRVKSTDRIAPSPKPSNTPIMVAVLIVASIIGAFGLWQNHKSKERQAMQERMDEIDRQLAAQREAENLEAERRYQQNKAQQELNRPLSEPPRARVQSQASQGRQTDFNDHNYTPKGATNSMQAPPRRFFEQKKNQGILIERKVASWSWQSYGYGSGGQKRWVSGQFTYLVKNGVIDNSSVCANENYGTLRYRDCRKGAKDYFAKKCKSGNREACTGSEMIP